jgi:gas vesicle protein
MTTFLAGMAVGAIIGSAVTWLRIRDIHPPLNTIHDHIRDHSFAFRDKRGEK